MNCREFQRDTERWMEGVRSQEACEHLAACDRCRCLVDDLEAIRLVAPQLAEEANAPERLWASIHAELAHERVPTEWMEGVRTEEAREHLAACGRCRSLVEDLEAIQLAAPQLAEEVNPPDRLWASIRSELAHERVPVEWMEGVRSQETSEHLAACQRCRSLVDDFEAIRSVAPQLAEEVNPPARLWASIRSALAHERVPTEWMEGIRSEETREHLAACERCRSLVDDFEAIRSVAPQLAEEVDPPERLWASIRAKLEHEDSGRKPGWIEGFAGWFRIPARPLAGMATAVLAIALATVFVTSRNHRPKPRQPDWLSTDQPELSRVDSQLDHVELRAVQSMRTDDPAVSDALEQNLAIINRQIALCEKTLEQAPSDENTRDYLYDAYQQKADLLSMIAERSASPAE